ncbi:hypothetical protein F7725_023610 [Dissostichus mawsoni]|uniref:Uncharacterized protein n=1 Tax=Dissostichus mawsoni TaxID=36200 RepID=A0A7J5XYM1_DISMA|nr:hypothetical protein F7725_023610 [Dissostichus mawsoni]
MAVNVLGIIAMVFLYLLVLGVGIWAFFKSRKKRDKCPGESLEISLLGNRSIGRVVGIFTTAGGLFFAGPMRDKKYVTMMDPFHIK